MHFMPMPRRLFAYLAQPRLELVLSWRVFRESNLIKGARGVLLMIMKYMRVMHSHDSSG
jgi:hypothetical protein